MMTRLVGGRFKGCSLPNLLQTVAVELTFEGKGEIATVSDDEVGWWPI